VAAPWAKSAVSECTLLNNSGQWRVFPDVMYYMDREVICLTVCSVHNFSDINLFCDVFWIGLNAVRVELPLTIITSSGKRNLTVWRPSVRLSVCPVVFLILIERARRILTVTHQRGGEHDRDAASVHFRPSE